MTPTLPLFFNVVYGYSLRKCRTLRSRPKNCGIKPFDTVVSFVACTHQWIWLNIMASRNFAKISLFIQNYVWNIVKPKPENWYKNYNANIISDKKISCCNFVNTNKPCQILLILVCTYISISHLHCSALTLVIKSTWPALYCSKTSFTS